MRTHAHPHAHTHTAIVVKAEWHNSVSRLVFKAFTSVDKAAEGVGTNSPTKDVHVRNRRLIFVYGKIDCWLVVRFTGWCFLSII